MAEQFVFDDLNPRDKFLVTTAAIILSLLLSIFFLMVFIPTCHHYRHNVTEVKFRTLSKKIIGVCHERCDGPAPNPLECSQYFQCNSQLGIHKSCPEGQLYDPKMKNCSSKPIFECSKVSTPFDNDNDKQCGRIVCYYSIQSQHRKMVWKFAPSNVDAFLCTHIIWHGHIDVDTDDIINVFFGSNDKLFYQQIITKKKDINPNLRILLSLGDDEMKSNLFSDIIVNPNRRLKFINAVVDIVKQYNFDGVDINYLRTLLTSKFKIGFLDFLQGLKSKFVAAAVETGKDQFLLTTSVGGRKDDIDNLQNTLSEIVRQVDYINLQAFDFYPPSGTKVAHHSALKTSDDVWDVYSSAAYFVLKSGVPKNKLVIGIPMYGRVFNISGSKQGCLVGRGVGTSGRYTKEDGLLSYYEICELIVGRKGDNHIGLDTLTNGQTDPLIGPYLLVDGETWIGYEDTESALEKVKFVLEQGYGGVTVWDLSLDDFQGRLCNQGNYPILNSIYRGCNM